MGSAEELFLRRYATLERTRGCRSCLFRRGIPGTRDRTRPQTAGAYARDGGAFLSRPPLRGGPQFSQRLERPISWTPDRPNTPDGDALQRPVRDASDLL